MVLALSGCAAPREPVPGPPPADRLFAGHEIFGLTLEFDQASVFKERSGESTYHPARLEYLDTAGQRVRLEIEVRTRGHYRRKRENCRFPPLRLNFARKQAKGTVFAGQDKLKLVTHCQGRYEQYVLQEHLVYRLYNLMTERSFRVRLVEVTYVDSGGRNPLRRYAFFIEDVKTLAERNGFVPFKEPEVPYEALDAEELSRLEVFQYMVGNTDWSVLRGSAGDDCCHNSKPIRASDGQVVAVPYDFDLAGAVNAPYASPNPDLGIRSVRQRLWRGFCRPNGAHLDAAIAAYQARRDDIYALYRAETRLEPRRLSLTLAWFDRFYDTIGEPDGVRGMLRRCRTPPA